MMNCLLAVGLINKNSSKGHFKERHYRNECPLRKGKMLINKSKVLIVIPILFLRVM